MVSNKNMRLSGAKFLSLFLLITIIVLSFPIAASAVENYQFVNKWPTSSAPQFQYPMGVTTTKSGSYAVFVADTVNHRIQKLDANGKLLTTWGSYGTGNGQFVYPSSVAYGNGYVYVADQYNHRIQKFNWQGLFVASWGGFGAGDGQFNFPYGIAHGYDEYGDSVIYVADTGNNRIQKFDDNGNFIAAWGSYGTAVGQFSSPRGVAMGFNGDVFVADTGNNRIQMLPNGGAPELFAGGYGAGDGEFKYPRGVAVDSSGNVWVADTDNHRVQKFNQWGVFLSYYRDTYSLFPSGVSVTDSGDVFIAQTDAHFIQKLNASGSSMWGSYGSGTPFSYPEGAAVDSFGNVYVVDKDNHIVQKFDPNGAFISKWGGIGTGDGQFYYPTGVAASASGYVYVADQSNNRIQKFDLNGSFITKWGQAGPGPGEFSSPSGVGVDSSGNVYVADTWNNRIQKFDPNGIFITSWGSFGYGNNPVQFYGPRGVAVDLSGNIYVADTASHRVKKLNSNGIFISEWTWGSGDGQVLGPSGIAVDAAGNGYVADTNNARVQKFDSNMVFVTKWGNQGSNDGLFNEPRGVAVNASGNFVYVADTLNHRIQKFALDPNPPTISNISAAPNPFNNKTGWPAMSGTTLSYTLSEDAKVTIVVFNSGGLGVATIANNSDKVAGAQSVWWNGRQGGFPLPAGNYQIKITATDAGGNSGTAYQDVTIDNTEPTVSTSPPSPNPFSPNGDGVEDVTTLNYTVYETVQAYLYTYDSNNAMIRFQNLGVIGAGSHSATWDGKNDSGAVMPDGTYRLLLYVWDAAWNGAGVNNNVVINTAIADTDPPTISNLRPADGSTVNNTKPTIAADYADTGSGINVSSVKLFIDGVDKTSASTVTNGSVSYVPSIELAQGSYTVRVDVSDNVGNAATATWTFNVVRPRLIPSRQRIYWASWLDFRNRVLSIDFAVANRGGGEALDAVVTNVTATNGVAVLTPLPIPLGTIAPGGAQTFTVRYWISLGVRGFRTNLTGIYKDAGGNVYNF